jgi:hypoxanthine phosphoribosyltransferase
VGTYSHRHKGVTEITWQRFGELCKELALKVLAYDPDVIIGIAKGGVLPAAVLASMLRKEFYPIRLSRRYDDRVVRDQPAVLVGVPDIVAGKRVLIVDDISVTGKTLQMAAEQAKMLEATAAKTASLFVHSFSYKPHYFVLETDALIISPWDYLVLKGGQFAVHPEYQEELDEMRKGGQCA